MSEKKNRLARKAARVQQTDADRGFNAALGELKRQLDAKLRDANIEHENARQRAKVALAQTRKAAYKEYEEGRDALLRAVPAEGGEPAEAAA